MYLVHCSCLPVHTAQHVQISRETQAVLRSQLMTMEVSSNEQYALLLHTHKCTHTCAHKHTHTHMYMHTHTHTHTHFFTDVHALS